jgi:hypothetical protein
MLIITNNSAKLPAYRAITGEIPSPHRPVLFEAGQKLHGCGRYDKGTGHSLIRAPEAVTTLAFSVMDLINQGRMSGDYARPSEKQKCRLSKNEVEDVHKFIKEVRLVLPEILALFNASPTDIVSIATQNPSSLSQPSRLAQECTSPYSPLTSMLPQPTGDFSLTSSSSPKQQILSELSEIEKNLTPDNSRITYKQAEVLKGLAKASFRLTLSRPEWENTIQWELRGSELIARIAANVSRSINILLPEALPGDRRRLTSALIEEYLIRESIKAQTLPIKLLEDSLPLSAELGSDWFQNTNDYAKEYREFAADIETRYPNIPEHIPVIFSLALKKIDESLTHIKPHIRQEYKQALIQAGQLGIRTHMEWDGCAIYCGGITSYSLNDFDCTPLIHNRTNIGNFAAVQNHLITTKRFQDLSGLLKEFQARSADAGVFVRCSYNNTTSLAEALVATDARVFICPSQVKMHSPEQALGILEPVHRMNYCLERTYSASNTVQALEAISQLIECIRIEMECLGVDSFKLYTDKNNPNVSYVTFEWSRTGNPKANDKHERLLILEYIRETAPNWKLAHINSFPAAPVYLEVDEMPQLIGPIFSNIKGIKKGLFVYDQGTEGYTHKEADLSEFGFEADGVTKKIDRWEIAVCGNPTIQPKTLISKPTSEVVAIPINRIIYNATSDLNERILRATNLVKLMPGGEEKDIYALELYHIIDTSLQELAAIKQPSDELQKLKISFADNALPAMQSLINYFDNRHQDPDTGISTYTNINRLRKITSIVEQLSKYCSSNLRQEYHNLLHDRATLLAIELLAIAKEKPLVQQTEWILETMQLLGTERHKWWWTIKSPLSKQKDSIDLFNTARDMLYGFQDENEKEPSGSASQGKTLLAQAKQGSTNEAEFIRNCRVFILSVDSLSLEAVKTGRELVDTLKSKWQILGFKFTQKEAFDALITRELELKK